jgi:hypothetical protein
MKKWILAIIATVLTMIATSALIVLVFGETSGIPLIIGAGISYYTGRYVYKRIDKSNSVNKSNKKEESPYLGGDGLSAENPVFINCASGSMAQHLIDRFISEKHGEKDSDWEMGISFTIDSDKTKCGMIKAISVKTGQEELNYFFDLSRPMAVLEKFI